MPSWIPLILTLSLAVAAGADEILFDFEPGFELAKVEQRSVTASLDKAGENTWLRVATTTREAWPGLTVKPPRGQWDLTRYAFVALDVENLDDTPVTVNLRVDNPGADGTKNCLQGGITLQGRDKGTLRLAIDRVAVSPDIKLFGMRGYPVLSQSQGRTIDPAKVVAALVFVSRPERNHLFRVDNLRAEGTWSGPSAPPLTAAEFFPFIDTFGQYIHRDWPGKVHSLDELRGNVAREAAELAAHPEPKSWNKWGGWADGPTLQATGHFRTEQVNGVWWLVDPEGKLYWAHGTCGVRAGHATPIDERETWFKEAPWLIDDSFRQFLGKGRSIKGHYAGREPQTYDFARANLLRKYGPQWAERFREVSQQRLRSWGMNNIGNWSEPALYLLRRTPYTATGSFSSPPIAGSEGYWGQFKDPFHPEFAAAIARTAAGFAGKEADDPWCVGIFVDNEIGWGDETSLALAALASPADQPAKVEFLADLRAKYQTIDRLNAAWGTQHASWEALLASRARPDVKAAGDDLKAFYTRIAEAYFATIKAALKKVAPNTLYLGCRFAWVNDRAALAAAKYVDVMSYNLYRDSVADFKPPAGIDLPVIIGEFHFGALDRGMFHTGLRKAANQDERAAKYRSYVEGALRNRHIVGSHWFIYTDQPATGRTLDEENYQIGLVDGCDTPYPETIAALRQVGATMYTLRHK